MPVPTGRLTRREIREQGCRQAGNFPLASTDAPSWLAQILFDLYTGWDWAFLKTQATLAATGETVPLPADFLKPADDGALSLTSFAGSATYVNLLLLSREEFERLRAVGSATGQPTHWVPDYDAATARLWPNPAGFSASLVLRYKRLPPEPDTVDEPADVPVFPWHLYLRHRVYEEALRHEGDPRLEQAVQRGDQMLSAITKLGVPRGSGASVVPFARTHFGSPFRVW